MQAARTLSMTEAEYLEFDAASPGRYEFYNGEVVAMAGAEPEHGAVVAALSHAIGIRLEGRSCLVWSADQRVRVDETGLYAYPDLVAGCAPFRFADTHPRTLLNPVVVIEVLSASTETTDRGPKFAHFQSRPSVHEYVLVTASARRIEHYRRLDADRWELVVVTGTSTLSLPALGLSIPLDEVYRDAEMLAGHSEVIDG